jgi:hypothetical protein
MRDLRPIGVLATLLLAGCGAPRREPAPPPAPPVPPVPGGAPSAEEHATATDEPPAPAHPWEAPGVRSATSRAGVLVVKWRPLVGGEPVADVPNNAHFELDVWLLDPGGAPLAGQRLSVLGWMPDHGHGMIRRPIARDLGGGHYRVEGMLLHMGGLWQLFFDVPSERGPERTEFVVEL